MIWKNEEGVGREFDAPTNSFGIANYAKVSFWTGHCHCELESRGVSDFLSALKIADFNKRAKDGDPTEMREKMTTLAIESSPFI